MCAIQGGWEDERWTRHTWHSFTATIRGCRLSVHSVFITELNLQKGEGSVASEEVQTVRLSEIVNEKIHLMKLDVEVSLASLINQAVTIII